MLNQIDKFNEFIRNMGLRPFDIALEHVKNITEIHFKYNDLGIICSIKILVQYEADKPGYWFALDLTKYFGLNGGNDYARWEFVDDKAFFAFKLVITTIEKKNKLIQSEV